MEQGSQTPVPVLSEKGTIHGKSFTERTATFLALPTVLGGGGANSFLQIRPRHDGEEKKTSTQDQSSFSSREVLSYRRRPETPT